MSAPHGTVLLGELAALGTALCWTVSALAGSAGGRAMGSLPYNIARLLAGFLFLMLLCWLWRGQALPLDASPRQWLWLLLSGFIGFFLGDLPLFRALVLIGPRLSMLIMCLWPPLAAILGWALLGEDLGGLALLGMVLTLGGVVWVTAEGGRGGKQGEAAGLGGSRRLGIILAILGACGQALGYVIAGYGLRSEAQAYDGFASTQIRILAGLAAFIPLAVFSHRIAAVWQGLRSPRSLAIIGVGGLFGPCLGVGLALLALQWGCHAGVAATLASLTPILVIPAVILLHQERVSLRAWIGAALAVSGVAIIFLR